jgi:class 3 adenylate cyclase
MSSRKREDLTFLFTDIEGSTPLWEEYHEIMMAAVEHHETLLRWVIEHQGGRVFKTVGDGLYAVFDRAPDAVAAALAAQRALAASAAPEAGSLADARSRAQGASRLRRSPRSLRVRIALHTGVAEERGGDYFGAALNRAARLLAVGHGGQTLLSGAICERVRDALPEGTSLKDLGQYRLRDLQRPEHVFQLRHPELPAEFPPLKFLHVLPTNLVRLTALVVGYILWPRYLHSGPARAERAQRSWRWNSPG